MKRDNVVRLLALIAAIILLVTPLYAQSTATVQGTVLDTQNAAVPGATVVVRNTATGVERTLVTDATGNFVAASLPPGPYQVEISLQGFQTQTRDVTLQVSQTRALDIQMGLAAVAEQVNVTAEAPVIDTATVSVGTVINQRTVQEIPLNGRHFVDLGLLIPGSVTPPQNGFLTAPLRGQGSFAFNTAGNREDTVNFMVNGINLNDMLNNQITFQPSINTVQEFKVDNSTFAAEYGRNSGAIVNIATRSGTNQFSGEAFEFYRNDRFDSRNAFNTPPARKSPFNRNQFGAALGGPIARNRTFFFATYEGLRQRQGIDINSGVLSATERAAVTDPISRQLLQFIPEQNATVNGAPRFIGSATAPVNIDQWTGDVSHNAGVNDVVHGYYAFQRDLRGEPTLQLNTIPGFGDTRHSHRQIGTLNETHVFSQRLVNEARFGFNRINITFEPNMKANPGDLGIRNGVTTPIGLPQITINGPALNFGGPQNFPQGRTDTTSVVSDTATLSAGRHNIRFGGEWRRFRNVNFTNDTGRFDFPSVAAFQTGIGNNFTIILGDRASDIRVQAYGLFVSDSYKLAPNLTVDAGVRFDSNLAPKDPQNRLVVFDAATGSLVRVGSSARPKVYDDSHDVSPRVGVIWDPTNDGRTAVRAAYARTVDQPITNAVNVLAGNPPLATPLTFTGNIRLDNAQSTALAGGLAPLSISPDFHGGHMQTWNVNVERQIFASTSAMVGYFGSKGNDLRLPRNLNQFVNGVRPFPTVSASSQILPGTPLGNITETVSLGESHYKGLWVSATQRLSRGLQFDASYTLSKSTDTNSLSENTIRIQNSLNILGDLAPSDFDARHRFVINTIYMLPFSGNALVEGWQIGGIVQAQTGNPVNLVTNITTFNGVVNTLRPDLIGKLDVIGDRNQWFENSACDPRIAGSCSASSVLAIPVSPDGTFHFGNLPRNAVYGPGFRNVDLSITKNTPLGGNRRVQLRIEIFNLFNTANLGQPVRILTVPSTSFGTITNTRFPTGDSGSARQVQFAAKYLF
jgi:Carboxypeptidase regulatory-like domain/TonB dependent receptor-like, beta-barrel